jgi:hypothetical protein
MLHLIDRLLLDELTEAWELPVLAHFGVQEVLIDRHQFFPEGFVQSCDYFRIACHIASV